MGPAGEPGEQWVPEEELGEEAHSLDTVGSYHPLGLVLVLRRSQEQQEVGKRRKSKKNSWGGLATQDLDVPRLHLASLAAGLVPGQHRRCSKRGKCTGHTYLTTGNADERLSTGKK